MVNPSQLFSEQYKALQQNVIFVFVYVFIIVLVLNKIACPRGTKDHLVYFLNFVCFILRMLAIFLCLLSIFFNSQTKRH